MRIQPILNVLVTGAGNGIGKSVCEYYYSKGINVIGIDIIFNEEAPYPTFVADITNKESLQIVSDYLNKNKIILDAIVNIAGVLSSSDCPGGGSITIFTGSIPVLKRGGL